jgi:hypothetical protein
MVIQSFNNHIQNGSFAFAPRGVNADGDAFFFRSIGNDVGDSF